MFVQVQGRPDDDPSALAVHRVKVFHAALLKILKSAIRASGKDGFTINSRSRRLLAKIIIAILSMDYEEAYVPSRSQPTKTYRPCRSRAASILGAKSGFPCPICLVPKFDLSNLAARYPPRTKQGTMGLLREAKAAQTKSARHEILLRQSIRYMTVRCDVRSKLLVLSSQ